MRGSMLLVPKLAGLVEPTATLRLTAVPVVVSHLWRRQRGVVGQERDLANGLYEIMHKTGKVNTGKKKEEMFGDNTRKINGGVLYVQRPPCS